MAKEYVGHESGVDTDIDQFNSCFIKMVEKLKDTCDCNNCFEMTTIIYVDTMWYLIWNKKDQ